MELGNALWGSAGQAGKGMVADSSSGKSRVVVWEYREVCRVPVTAEFMASAQ